MSNLFLCFTFIHLLFIAAAYKGDRNEDLEEKLAWANSALTIRLLYNRLLEYPEKSHSVSGLPILALFAQAALHADGNKFQELAQWLNLDNKHEIRQVFPTMIERMMNDSNIDLTFRAFTDEHLSAEFRQNFKNVFNGDTQYINYSDVCDATNDINYWFKKQFDEPTTNVIESDYLRQRNEGIIFGNYMYTRTSFDHPFNPKGFSNILFRRNENEVKNLVALYGVGFVRYAELPELKANIIVLASRGEQNSVAWVYPTNPEDLMSMIHQIQDPNVLKAAYSKLKTACLKLYITVGQSHAVNRVSTFIPELNLELSGLNRVHDDYKPTSVYGVLQRLHLIADQHVRRGPINSPKCPDSVFPLVKIDRPFLYIVSNALYTPIYAGVQYGDEN